MDRGQEREIVEEMAASLVDSVVESIGGSSLAVTDEALRLLGIADGEEMMLPDSFDDDSFAGELIAETLLTRPEVINALVALGTLLVKRVKMCE